MPDSFEVEVFYDGECPLCRREIAMLRRWDHRNRIHFTDISAADFSPDSVGRTFDELMASIHGRLLDGSVIQGVEVFRRLYAAVGLGPLVWLSRWPGISHILDCGYWLFARNRLRLTGRCVANACDVARNRPPARKAIQQQ